jgi:phosphoribosylglycinamide formyltransferase-1
MSTLRLAFFVSGNGTLFEAITTRCRDGVLNAEPALLISSHSDAPALERAARLNVPATVIRRDQFSTGTEFAEALLQKLADGRIDLVCLAGYLKLVPPRVVAEYKNRMLNIHPALLPAFGGKGMYGRHVHEAVLESGARLAGATVHLVDAEYDRGPILLQRPVFVHMDDTVESLEQRVHAIEYDLYVEAVRLFTEDRIEINGRRTKILPGKSS